MALQPQPSPQIQNHTTQTDIALYAPLPLSRLTPRTPNRQPHCNAGKRRYAVCEIVRRQSISGTGGPGIVRESVRFPRPKFDPFAPEQLVEEYHRVLTQNPQP